MASGGVPRRNTSLASESDRSQLRFVSPRHDPQQLVGELPPDNCPDLCNFLCWSEPVEPRHQRCVQACGDGQSRRGNGGGVFHASPSLFRFQHRLGHFLNEQRDAVSALDNVLPNALRQRLIARDAVDYGSDFVLPKPVEREGSHAGLSDPRRLELWPERHDQQHTEAWYSVHDATK
jgi:hypothetical protein